MRREDWPVGALLTEAVCLILETVYLVLQIYFGLAFHVPAYKWILNILMSLLVYALLSLLVLYPEKINRLSEVCTGQVRRLSIRMVRIVKLVFVGGLMVPSVGDAFGVRLPDEYSLLVMAAMLAVAAYYEIRIIKIVQK